jgi:hypothetical protein
MLSHFSHRTREMGHPVLVGLLWTSGYLSTSRKARDVGHPETGLKSLELWSTTTNWAKTVFGLRCRFLVNRSKLHEWGYVYAGWADIFLETMSHLAISR